MHGQTYYGDSTVKDLTAITIDVHPWITSIHALESLDELVSSLQTQTTSHRAQSWPTSIHPHSGHLYSVALIRYFFISCILSILL